MTKFKSQAKIMTVEELAIKVRDLVVQIARARVEKKPTLKLRKQLAIVKTYANNHR